MAKKKRGKKAVAFNEDATIRKLTSQLVDPRVQSWLWGGARGVRERILQLNFDTLRRSVNQLPLINGIINTRQDQILPFLKHATEQNDRGFTFEIENRLQEFRGAKEDPEEVLQLVNFIEQTGFMFDGEREDDFMDYASMIIRDVYEIDQIATEVQYNRLGEPIAFWGLDGATIARVNDEKRWNRNIRFVQMIDQKIYEEYRSEDLIFDYKFKRSDVRYRGYGYSPVEMCINIITTLLFGYNYIRDQLIKDKVPKGFISVMGDVGQEQMDSIRNYWYAAMTGSGAQFTIPILPSGKDGVGVDFKDLSRSNKDMEYHRTMMFISSLVGAVFSMDLAELGIKTDDSTSIIGENAEPRIQSSKDRGLASMLSFIEQHVNKIIRKVTKKYRFKFVGLIRDDEQKKADVRNKQIQGWRTIDDVRKEDGEKPFNEPWSSMPLNAQAVQMFLALNQQEQGQAPGGGEGIPEDLDVSGGIPEDRGETEDEEESPNSTRIKNNEESVEKSLEDFQSLTRAKERTLRVVVE